MTPPKKTAKNSPAAAPVGEIPLPEMTLEETREHRKEIEKLWGPLPELGIAERIKEARLRPGNDLSIEALSRLSKMIDPAGQGIAQQTIVRYEKGIVLPGARELRILSDALAVSTDFLIFGRERSGTVDMDVALKALSRVLHERLTAENPYTYPPPNAIDERPMLLAKAKEPKPRK